MSQPGKVVIRGEGGSDGVERGREILRWEGERGVRVT